MGARVIGRWFVWKFFLLNLLNSLFFFRFKLIISCSAFYLEGYLWAIITSEKNFLNFVDQFYGLCGQLKFFHRISCPRQNSHLDKAEEEGDRLPLSRRACSKGFLNFTRWFLSGMSGYIRHFSESFFINLMLPVEKKRGLKPVSLMWHPRGSFWWSNEGKLEYDGHVWNDFQDLIKLLILPEFADCIPFWWLSFKVRIILWWQHVVLNFLGEYMGIVYMSTKFQ